MKSVKNQIAQMLRRNLQGLEDRSNCWNTTRKLHGDKIPYRWEKMQAMENWLNTRCYEIGFDQLAYGDIIGVWDDYNDWLSHTAFFMGFGCVFHKYGVWPFEKITLKQMVDD